MQIAESVAGRRRIVRHVGSARDEVELGLLMAQARRLLEDDAQGELDLGLSLPVSKAAMVPAPAGTLFSEAGSLPSRRAVVAGPRVLRTSSVLLFDALAGVYADLGFSALDGGRRGEGRALYAAAHQRWRCGSLSDCSRRSP